MDDWLCDEADEREVIQRNHDTEVGNLKKQRHNQGYLEGLEWADDNYMSLDGMTEVAAAFHQGVELGLKSAKTREFKFDAIGRLNVLLMTGNPEAAELLQKLNLLENDAEISESLKARINTLLE